MHPINPSTDSCCFDAFKINCLKIKIVKLANNGTIALLPADTKGIFTPPQYPAAAAICNWAAFWQWDHN